MNVNSQTSVKEMRKQGGDPDLLLYNAMKTTKDGIIVVSNGFQTDSDPVWVGEGREKENLKGSKPNGGIINGIISKKYGLDEAIRKNLKSCGSEVDPIRTARIAYAADFDEDPYGGNFGIVLRPAESSTDEVVCRYHANKILDNGRNFLIFSTYGVNNPGYYDAKPPSTKLMSDWTKMIHLDSINPDEIVEELFEALPHEIMVGVAAAMRDKDQPHGFRFSKKNMVE